VRNILAILLLVLLSQAALADIIHVPGDQPTIESGLSAATSGDTVLVSCGTYYESYLSIPAGVLLRSETGSADCTTLDGEGWNLLFEMDSPALGAAIEGFTLLNGMADGMPGGIYLYDSNLEIRDCAFVDCSPGLQLEGASTANLGGCTFYSCEGALGSDISALDNSIVIAQNCLLAFGEWSEAVFVEAGSNVTFTCSDIYGNSVGDWTGAIAGQLGVDGNFSEDPHFCDAPIGELTLEEFSKCVINSDCGLIGALPVACLTPNLLENSGFEDQSAGWIWEGSFSNPTQNFPDSLQAYEGDWSAFLRAESSDTEPAYWDPAYLHQTVSVVPDEDYVLRFQYLVNNTHVGDPDQILEARITYTDASQQDLATAVFEIPHAESWTSGGLMLTAPANADSCTVSFAVEPEGGYDTEIINIYVDATSFSPVRTALACGEASATVITLAEPVNFTSCSLGQITSFQWDFGDGGGSVEENPAYSYTQPGLYDVSLVVHNAQISDTTSVATIEVLDDPPVACFTASDTLAAPPVTINFTNCSSGFVTGYEWDFGDESQSVEESPSHYYEWPGLYDVSLVTFGAVQSDTTNLQIEILPPSAVLLSILDIPGDQGGELRLTWTASAFDVFDAPVSVTDYALYRRIEGAPRDGDRWPPGSWDFIVEVPASGELEYNTVVATLCDSTLAEGQCWSVFFIRAMTMEPTQFYDSLPDSGYSLDNLAPSTPGNFLLDYGYPIGNTLNWDEITDLDFDYFKVYRGEVEDFTPNEENLIHLTISTSWEDAMGEHAHHYKVSAVDYSGNEGNAASPGETTEVLEAPPTHFALHQNNPNPFNPATSILFDLPTAGKVRLEIFDVAGRRVALLAEGIFEAGRHELIWHGKDGRGKQASSGVYFYRLTGSEFTQTKSMLLIK
jgi:PKD repeat protein